MNFIVEPSVFQTLKGVCFAVVKASGIDNTQKIPEIDMLLQKALILAKFVLKINQ